MALPTEQDLLLALPNLLLSPASKVWVAYSGGLDSQVLLALTHKSFPASQVRAVHIHHGLHADADQWQQHCEQYCRETEIPLSCIKVQVDTEQSSLESQARSARYHEFTVLLDENDFLLMAHHQDDQMETVLYRLLRGSGPRGLSGMPQQRQLGKGNLIRPLLSFSKEELQAYAEQNGLSWVEDSSNSNTGFDRNFLRQALVPLLKQRWPTAGQAFERSARLCEEAEDLLQDLAELDAESAVFATEPRLRLEAVKPLSKARQRNLLRCWFQKLSKQYDLPQPGFEELRRLVDELIPAADDAMPLVSWKSETTQVQVRRFQDCLYVLKNFTEQGVQQSYSIRIGETLKLPDKLGQVCLREKQGEGVPINPDDTLEIRFNCEQSKVKPLGRKSRSFKKVYQDYAVPPWMRDRIPLLFLNGELAAVGDIFVCDFKRDVKPQKQVIIEWGRADIHCGY